MTSTLAAPRAASPRVRLRAPEPRRAAPPRGPAHLRLVEAPLRVTRRRTLVATAILTVLTLFTVVAFHVELARSQINLDQLGGRIDAAQQRYARARLEHARLSAPARIVARAGQLGLVSPVSPPTPVTAPSGSSSASSSTDATAGSRALEGWSTVKPSLGDAR